MLSKAVGYAHPQLFVLIAYWIIIWMDLYVIYADPRFKDANLVWTHQSAPTAASTTNYKRTTLAKNAKISTRTAKYVEMLPSHAYNAKQAIT